MSGATLLKTGQLIRENLSAGKTHTYYIDLDHNAFLNGRINVESLQATLTLYGPDAQQLDRIACREDGPTPFSLIARVAGRYWLAISAQSNSSAEGHYDLNPEQVRTAGDREFQREFAERSVAQGEELLKQSRSYSTRAAIEKFTESLTRWRALADRHEEGRTFKLLGDVHQSLGNYQTALAFYQRGLSLARQETNATGESEILSEIGYVSLSMGNTQKALEYCNRALALSQIAANPRAEAKALDNLGEVYGWSGKLQTALGLYQKSLALWRAQNNIRGQGRTLMFLGYTYSDLGQVAEAFNAYNEAVSLWQTTDDQHGLALAHNAFGRLHSRIGETQAALDSFWQAIQLVQQMEDPVEEAGILSGLAYVYFNLGDTQKALDYNESAVALFRQAKYPRGEAGALSDSGKIYLSLGNNEQALKYLTESSAIFKTIGNRRMEITSLREIGRVYASQGKKTEARNIFRTALAFYESQEDLRNQAVTLTLIGNLFEHSSQPEIALDYYEKAIPICKRADFRTHEAAVLFNIARTERARKNLTAANDSIHQAIRLIESLRTKVSGQDWRASYFASTHQYFELQVSILMELHERQPKAGFAAQAFDVSERARARSLLESLKSAGEAIREGVDPTLLKRERVLEQTINAKSERQAKLLTADNNDESSAIAAEITQLTNEYDEVRAQIKLKSPRYAALTQPQPITLNELQQRVLDENSILLEYMLGDERSYLWAVTRNAEWSYELPPRAEIESAANTFYKFLTAYQPIAGETAAERETRIQNASAHLPEAAASLGNSLLGPVKEQLGNKRLLIIPDGALQYIPFEALTIAATNTAVTKQVNNAGEQVPLLLDHEVVYEPSASSLSLLLSDVTQRRTAPKSVAVFANPVFEADDPRVQSGRSKTSESIASAQTQDVQKAFRDVGIDNGGHITPLPASRDEAQSIVSLAPWRSSFQALNFDASRANLSATDLGQFRVVHFATHGFVDYEHPELSGLVLSLVDQQGKPQEGFLRMHDIYNLKLPVDLVVLSACNTALGKEVKGEGLIGLTRAFMYAGAKGVVASLWKVDDEATAELMKRFYEGMFQRGLTPAAALREAQLSLWRQKRWQAPYYWGAFVIQGKYDQNLSAGLSSEKTRSWYFALSFIGVAVALFAFWLIRRRRRGIL